MALIDTLKEKFGAEFHPAILLAEVVQNDNQEIKLRVDCAKSLMPYLEATRKAVELKGDINANVGLLRVSIRKDDDE